MPEYNHLTSQLELIECNYVFDEPLSRHTTFKIGGNCDVMLFPNNREKLIKSVDLCKQFDIKFMLLGNGSDMVFGSAGYRGVIISTSKMTTVKIDNNRIICDCGVNIASLCVTACEHSLSGAERLYGIPGTVGGAVCMNAGAYGGQINDIIVNCTYYDGENIVTATTDELELSYRHSIFSNGDYIILDAEFEFEPSDKDSIKSLMADYMQRRRDKQPLEYPSAGSAFLRPPGHFAGALIEQCGLKGYTVGGAQVSAKHAGFIINIGNATSNDIKKLVNHIKETVLQNTGVLLECEIKFAGDDL